MFTDQSRSVKSRIIALHNSPGIPWHIVLLCSLQAGSPTETEISKNKLGLCSFSLLFLSHDQILSCHRKKKKKERQNLQKNKKSPFCCESCRIQLRSRVWNVTTGKMRGGKKRPVHYVYHQLLHIHMARDVPVNKTALEYCISNSICSHLKVADKQNKQMFHRAQLIIPEHSSTHG